MPWKKSTLAGISAGLRQSAQNGQFVPGKWIAEVNDGPGNLCNINACGWGHVGWIIAVMLRDTSWAKRMLPTDSEQEEIEKVLMFAGLTRQEIIPLAIEQTWKRFDAELWLAYENREQDWSAYIVQSMLLAEYFVQVLNRVEVVDEVPIPKNRPDKATSGRLAPWPAETFDTVVNEGTHKYPDKSKSLAA